jgi:hypothetical protein
MIRQFLMAGQSGAHTGDVVASEELTRTAGDVGGSRCRGSAHTDCGGSRTLAAAGAGDEHTRSHGLPRSSLQDRLSRGIATESSHTLRRTPEATVAEESTHGLRRTCFWSGGHTACGGHRRSALPELTSHGLRKTPDAVLAGAALARTAEDVGCSRCWSGAHTDHGGHRWPSTPEVAAAGEALTRHCRREHARTAEDVRGHRCRSGTNTDCGGRRCKSRAHVDDIGGRHCRSRAHTHS